MSEKGRREGGRVDMDRYHESKSNGMMYSILQWQIMYEFGYNGG